MYSVKNYQTRKQLVEDFNNGIKIKIYQPNQMFTIPSSGSTVIEGPHYPKPHKFYVAVEYSDFIVTKIKK